MRKGAKWGRGGDEGLCSSDPMGLRVGRLRLGGRIAGPRTLLKRRRGERISLQLTTQNETSGKEHKIFEEPPQTLGGELGGERPLSCAKMDSLNNGKSLWKELN